MSKLAGIVILLAYVAVIFGIYFSMSRPEQRSLFWFPPLAVMVGTILFRRITGWSLYGRRR